MSNWQKSKFIQSSLFFFFIWAGHYCNGAAFHGERRTCWHSIDLTSKSGGRNLTFYHNVKTTMTASAFSVNQPGSSETQACDQTCEEQPKEARKQLKTQLKPRRWMSEWVLCLSHTCRNLILHLTCISLLCAELRETGGLHLAQCFEDSHGDREFFIGPSVCIIDAYYHRHGQL